MLAGSLVMEMMTYNIKLYMKGEFKRTACVNKISKDWLGDKMVKELSHQAEEVFI